MSKTFAIGDHIPSTELDAKYEKTRAAAIGIYQKMRKFFPTGSADCGIWFADDAEKRVVYIHVGPMIRVSFHGPRSCAIGIRVVGNNSEYVEVAFPFSLHNIMRHVLTAAFVLDHIGFKKDDIQLCIYENPHSVLKNALFFGSDCQDKGQMARYLQTFDIGTYDPEHFIKVTICAKSPQFVYEAFKHTHNSSLVSPALYMNSFVQRNGCDIPVHFVGEYATATEHMETARPLVVAVEPNGMELDISFAMTFGFFGRTRNWQNMQVRDVIVFDENGSSCHCAYTPEVKEPWGNMRPFTEKLRKAVNHGRTHGKSSLVKRVDDPTSSYYIDTGVRAILDSEGNPDYAATFKSARLNFDCFAHIMEAHVFLGAIRKVNIVSVPVTPSVNVFDYPNVPESLCHPFHTILLELEIVEREPTI